LNTPKTRNQPGHLEEEVVEDQEAPLGDHQEEVLHVVLHLAEDTVTCLLLEAALLLQEEVVHQNEIVPMVVEGMTAMKDLPQNDVCPLQTEAHIHHPETMKGGAMTVRENDLQAMAVIDMVKNTHHQKEVIQVCCECLYR